MKKFLFTLLMCLLLSQTVSAGITKQDWESLKNYKIYSNLHEEMNLTIWDLNEYAKALLNGNEPEISQMGDNLLFNINETKILLKKQITSGFGFYATYYVPTSITSNGTIGNEFHATESIRAIVSEAETHMVERGIELPAQKKERERKEAEEQYKKFGDPQLLAQIQSKELRIMHESTHPLTGEKKQELKKFITIGELIQRARLVYPNMQPKVYSSLNQDGIPVIMLSFGGDYLPIIHKYEDQYEIWDIGASQFVDRLASEGKGK